MNEQEAVARAEAWLRSRPAGAEGERGVGPTALRIRPEYNARRRDGWNFTVNAVGFLDGTDPGTGLFPSPVLFVPDDGGEIVFDLAMTAAGAGTPADDEDFAEWRQDVDPEFDAAAFPELAPPVRAIRGWTQFTPYDQPTGGYRVNDQYTPGPLWRGFPRATTDAEKLLNYLGANWITRAEFVRSLLDREVIVPVVDGEALLGPVPGTEDREVLAYSSSAKVPGRYPQRWRVTVRDVLRDRPRTGLTLDPGTGLVRSIPWADLAEIGERYDEPEHRPKVDEPAPEAGPEVTGALPGLGAEFGIEPDLLARHLRHVAENARKYRFELSPQECLSYLRGFAWTYRNGLRRRAGQPEEWPADLAANGLIEHIDADGEPRPAPWTFGKFFARGTLAGRFAWHRIVGAYVGFAIGDALGGGADPSGPLPLGGLTRQLLFHTESVIRGLPPVTDTGEVPATLPAPDADGWLAKATTHAGPAPAEFSALLATAVAATPAGAVPLADVDGEKYAKAIAHELTGTAAGPEVTAGVDLLVALFQELLTTDEFAVPVHLKLRQLGGEAATSTLALRDDRAADDVVQLDGIGDGRAPRSVLGRALFAVAKRGYDPEAAITLAARSGPVAGALAGAMAGARLGVPGLPAAWVAALPDLGLLDDVASDVFFHFNRNGVDIEPGEQPRWERRYPSGRFTQAAPATGLSLLSLRSRLRGSLLAGAIGDALGAKTEFDSIDRIRELAGPDGITDFIPAYGGVGRITDDTQMTLFTLEGLIRAHAQQRRTGGADVVQSLQMAYQRWLHTQGVPWDRARGPKSDLAEPDGWLLTHQELFSRRAPGLTCFGELEAYGRTGVRSGVNHPVNNSKGCGGVMRAAPIALWSDDVAEVFRLGAESAALTHGHPSGYLSSGCFAVIVHELLHGKPLLDAVATARAELVKHPSHEEQTAAFDSALGLAKQGPPTPEKLESLGAGNIGETALSMSVYVALTTSDPDSALLTSVNHSGDSDSTGSVCGNLVGAMYGEEALRRSWLDRLELREVIGQLADDALAEFGPDAPRDDRWFARYPVY